MPDVLIREATEADLPSVLTLYGQQGLDDGRVLTAGEAVRIWRTFADYPDYTLYVAADGSEIVGTFALLVMHNLGHLGTPSSVVEDVAVAPSAQGRGIGRAMMRFAIERSREKGCYKLTLSSNAKRDRAHAFYEGMGFERHGYSFRVGLERSAR